VWLAVGSGDAAKGANPNKANALHAILFEAISLALHLDTDRKLLTTCVGALGRFLTTKVSRVSWTAG
jgi:AP-2 complex subunit alpha